MRFPEVMLRLPDWVENLLASSAQIYASDEERMQLAIELSRLDVRHLMCGARGVDAERMGFDEGMKPSGWVRSLEDRGSFVAQDVLRDGAASVLQQYTDEGGVIYNGRRG